MNRYQLERGQTPLRFMQDEEVILELNTLPLSSRTIEEILGDHAIEFACIASYNRSAIRRGPRRYNAVFVVDYLDSLADETDTIGNLAAEQINRHLALIATIPAKSTITKLTRRPGTYMAFLAANAE